jgi:hypothetical protein
VFGSLAQLVERHVYTVDVIGSIPVGPTNKEEPLSCENAAQGLFSFVPAPLVA